VSAKINLLPDVRQAKLQDKQRRQLAISVAIGTVLVAAVLLVIGFLVIQGQNVQVSKLSSKITTNKQKVASYPNVKAMLALQAKVAALPALYQQRAIITKLLNTISAVEPPDADFTNLSLTNDSQLVVTAEGKSFMTASRLADALKAANTVTGPGAKASNQPYFTNVQLSAVTLGAGKTGYSVTASVNPGAISGN